MKICLEKKTANGVEFVIIIGLCATTMSHTHTLLTACFTKESVQVTPLCPLRVRAKSHTCTQTPSPLSGLHSSKGRLRTRDACCPQCSCLRRSETCSVDSFLQPTDNSASWKTPQHNEPTWKIQGPIPATSNFTANVGAQELCESGVKYRISFCSAGDLSLLVRAAHWKIHAPKTTSKRTVQKWRKMQTNRTAAGEDVAECFCRPLIRCRLAQITIPLTWGSLSCIPLLPPLPHLPRAGQRGRGNQSVPHHREKSERVQSFT